MDETIAVLEKIVEILRWPDTDVTWSHYANVEEAITDVQHHIDRLQHGDASKISDLTLLFAPTGALQEISLSSGWGNEFIVLARQFDAAIAKVARQSNPS